MTPKQFYSKLSTPLLLIHLDNLEREATKHPEKIAALRAVLAKRNALASLYYKETTHA